MMSRIVDRKHLSPDALHDAIVISYGSEMSQFGSGEECLLELWALQGETDVYDGRPNTICAIRGAMARDELNRRNRLRSEP